MAGYRWAGRDPWVTSAGAVRVAYFAGSGHASGCDT